MTTEIRVPPLGESVTEATVARWLKQPGEAVERDDPVVELETDKVTLEVPAPEAGVIAEIRAAEGANVPAGAVLGIIADGAAAAHPHPSAAAAAGSPSPALRERVASEASRVRVSAEGSTGRGRRSASSSRKAASMRRN